jgi:hypothetical protein
MKLPLLYSLVAATALAGCTESAPAVDVRFADPITAVGNDELTHITTTDDAAVTGVELFADDVRVAGSDQAPFALAWTAAAYPDGTVLTLRAVAHAADGTTSAATLRAVVDNTAPAGLRIEGAFRAGEPVIASADDAAIARAQLWALRKGAEQTLLHDGPPTDPRTLALAITWTAPCDAVAARLVVVDAAGNRAERSVDLVAPPGCDADADGVPGVASGGTDCNDRDPAVHGAWSTWRHSQLRADHLPYTWTRADLGISTDRQIEAAFVHHGALEVAAITSDLGLVVDLAPEVVDAADDAPIAVAMDRDRPVIAYRRGGQLFRAAPDARGWVTNEVEPITAASDLVANRAAAGFLYRTPTDELHYLRGPAWLPEKIADRARAGAVTTISDEVFVTYTIDGALWVARSTAAGAWTATALPGACATGAVVAADGAPELLVARGTGAACTGPTTLEARTWTGTAWSAPARITTTPAAATIHAVTPAPLQVWYGADGEDQQVAQAPGGKWQPLPALSPAHLAPVADGNRVWFLDGGALGSERVIAGAADPASTAADEDCDGASD